MLDLLSISQTDFESAGYVDVLTGEKGEPEHIRSPGRCVYGAPMVALIVGERATIGQACCNHWDCPVCGVKRAKQEYRRIVSGCELLAIDHKLYFWTVTCRGRGCTLEEAEEHYYEWTNILLTNARTKCKRAGEHWAYAQITERQKKTRRHPHSHLITTFLPEDAQIIDPKSKRTSYTSLWFTSANLSAGLGSQHRLSLVENASAVSRYVAKYMFKDSMQEKWPAKWKRIRYSTNWPALPKHTPDFVAVLRSRADWRNVEKRPEVFSCESVSTFELARHHVANIRVSEMLDMTCN